MDGNYFADLETMKKLEGDGSIAFKYVDEAGNLTDEANQMVQFLILLEFLMTEKMCLV